MEKQNTESNLEKLVHVVRTLMAEDGCPWDRVQTLSSMKQYLLEEAYELAEIMDNNVALHRVELGDLLFQIVFQSLLREKEGAFTLDDAISSIVEKLILRHPHIFGNSPRRHEPDEALWEQAKLKEKQNASLMDDIPHTLPALMKADKIQRRAASVGFDWPDHQGPMDKVTEEFEELKEVIALQNQTAIEEEMGDLLFAVANLSRHLKINPETALMNANKKFQKRFRLMETMTGNDKRPLVTLSLEQQDLYWVQAKHRIREEKKSR